MLVVDGNRRKHHERSAPLVCRGPGHTWNVAEIALRISKALLNRKWFCTAGRSTVNLFNLYATTLRVDVENEGSVFLVPDLTCLLGPCKNILKISQIYPNILKWLALWEPRTQSCCPQPPTTILSACHLSSMYSSAEATWTVTYWKPGSIQIFTAVTMRIPKTIVICTFLLESACIQKKNSILHTVKMEIPTKQSSSSGTSWGMGETQTEGELQNHLHNSSGTPAWNIRKRASSML